MKKRIEFRANDSDVSRLTVLSKKLGITITAVIREAIRYLYKKETKS